jgi:hypothetical protein
MRSSALRVGATGISIAEGLRKRVGRLLPGVLEVVTVEGGRRQGGASVARRLPRALSTQGRGALQGGPTRACRLRQPRLRDARSSSQKRPARRARRWRSTHGPARTRQRLMAIWNAHGERGGPRDVDAGTSRRAARSLFVGRCQAPAEQIHAVGPDTCRRVRCTSQTRLLAGRGGDVRLAHA